MTCRGLSAAVVVCLVSAAGGVAAEPADARLTSVILRGEATGTASRLDVAEKLAREGKYAEAVEKYQAVLDDAGDDLVPVDARRSVSARRVCHFRIAHLPPAALRLYRGRVDPQAKPWLDRGLATRDTALLRRLVEDTFCSRHTEKALDALGDLAFERGDLEEAERYWQLIARPASAPREDGIHLIFPDPQGDVARVRAKQILARLFRGDLTGATQEIVAFRKAHPDARGTLAGRTGKYADVVQALADKPHDLSPLEADDDWPTFAGSPLRSRIAPKLPGPLTWLPPTHAPAWRVRLDTGEPSQDNEGRAPAAVRSPLHLARSLAFHPVVVGDQVLWADARYLNAHHLVTGKQLFRVDLLDDNAPVSLRLPAEPDLAYTLTATQDAAYLRAGTQALGPPKEGAAERSSLLCVELQPAPVEQRVRWEAKPKSEGRAAVFEGSPLVHQGRVYIAVSQFGVHRTQTDLACYDAGTGALLWQRPVCETPEVIKDGEARYRHHVLTLAGSKVVYVSHSGAVAAVDAHSGRPAWGLRYVSRGGVTEGGVPTPRGLAPAVYSGGRLFVAPSDLPCIQCLDPDSGGLLWESTPLEVIELLGVSRGRLVFTTTTPRPGLRALEAATGNPAWYQGELPAFGRGLLAADVVVWPTVKGLRILQTEDGEPAEDAYRAFTGRDLWGNLAGGNGCLVVAGLEDLEVFVPEARRLEERRQQGAAPGVPPRARYYLALAEAETGNREVARRYLAEVERQAATADLLDGLPLRDLARRRKLELDPRPVPGNRVRAPDGPPSSPGLGATARPTTRPDLPMPLRLTWRTGPGRLLVPDPGASPRDNCYLQHDNQLRCLDVATGRVRWEQTVSGPRTWVAHDGDLVLVAGPGGLDAFRQDDGKPAWHFTGPPSRVGPAFALGAFGLRAGRFYFLEGEQRLFALDSASGQTLWTRWAPGALIDSLPPGGRFHGALHAGTSHVLVTTTGGAILVYDSTTGLVTHQRPAAAEPKFQPPLALGERRVLLVPQADQVLLMDPTTGQNHWTYPLTRWPSLTGDAASLWADGRTLLIGISRNYGYELDNVDPETGKSRWPHPVFLGNRGPDPGSVCLDESAVYSVSRKVLSSRSLSNGAPRWQRPLDGPDGRWRVVRTQQAVAAYPDRVAEGEAMPVVFCDPANGRVLRRVDFPGSGGTVAVQWGERGAVLGAGDAVAGLGR